jgi:hypothetical protein
MARYNYEVPAELERIILKCLEKDPERRYQNPRDLLVDLENLLRDLGHADSAIQSQHRVVLQRESQTGTTSQPADAEPPVDLGDSDILIAGASVDNQPFSPDEPGWISQFQRNLEVRLEQLSGEPIKIAYHAGPAAAQLAEEPLTAMRQAKAMVSVVSPAFVKSEGCRRVMEEFWQAAEQSGGLWIENRPRIFKVVKTPVTRQDVPPGLDALLSQLLDFDFFEHDPETGSLREFDERFGAEARQHYFERVYDLAQEIWRVLSALRDHGPAETRSEDVAGRTVYLASATSDLRQSVDRLRRELLARGHEVG